MCVLSDSPQHQTGETACECVRVISNAVHELHFIHNKSQSILLLSHSETRVCVLLASRTMFGTHRSTNNINEQASEEKKIKCVTL